MVASAARFLLCAFAKNQRALDPILTPWPPVPLHAPHPSYGAPRAYQGASRAHFQNGVSFVDPFLSSVNDLMGRGNQPPRHGRKISLSLRTFSHSQSPRSPPCLAISSIIQPQGMATRISPSSLATLGEQS
eukprot:TRINITY_DN4160_c0_g2_i1.p2 TRINITY_DN4160_c0_g2~~TRINITY_DN4160_c0_g2_i1.p2  ORF type:complete len:131 (-),score=14.38 TRINITY_DN4160_c0_g2_i1:404-796(-)